MEDNYKTQGKSFINLKQLPPLDPDNISAISSKINRSHIEERNPVEDAERNKASESLKVEDASLGNKVSRQISTTRRKTTKRHKAHKTASNNEGEERPQGRAKSDLHEICAANKWQPPLFEFCMDEGPSHMKTLTFKVMVEIREGSSSTVLECFSAPQSRKKSAVNHAAEGALWGLKHLGYFSKNS
ncbi:Ribonuclease 3-like protein 1 [Morus notabilis]|uniref:Ribonuclease 3-like protein 1 n=1 Tax=Morus notabilis TaxID=981085 RepID=W9RE95_9ROSA|nr:Ribonuclease 3-like protein 1 [Morus notabilis]